MSQAKLRQARSLIQKKQYDEARAILETLDDPQARKWLAQIDKQQPGSSGSRTSRRQGGGGCARIIGYGLTLIVSALLTLALIGAMVIVTAPSRAEQNVMRATEAVLAVTATVQAALPTTTSTPTSVPVTGVVSAAQSVNVRSEPSQASAAVAALVPGTRVDLLSRSDDGHWYYIRFGNGQEGWLASDLVSAEGEVPTAVAEVPTETATPSDVCTAEEAQAWYDAQRPTLNQVKFLLMQLQGAKSGSGSFDYPANLPVIQDYRNKIESAAGLGCLSEVRSQLAAGLKAFENSLTNQINGFPNESTSEMNVVVEIVCQCR